MSNTPPSNYLPQNLLGQLNHNPFIHDQNLEQPYNQMLLQVNAINQQVIPIFQQQYVFDEPLGFSLFDQDSFLNASSEFYQDALTESNNFSYPEFCFSDASVQNQTQDVLIENLSQEEFQRDFSNQSPNVSSFQSPNLPSDQVPSLSNQNSINYSQQAIASDPILANANQSSISFDQYLTEMLTFFYNKKHNLNEIISFFIDCKGKMKLIHNLVEYYNKIKNTKSKAKEYVNKIINFLFENPDQLGRVLEYNFTTCKERDCFNKYTKIFNDKKNGENHSFPITVDSNPQTIAQDVMPLQAQIQEHELSKTTSPCITNGQNGADINLNPVRGFEGMALDIPEKGRKRTAEEAIAHSSSSVRRKRLNLSLEAQPAGLNETLAKFYSSQKYELKVIFSYADKLPEKDKQTLVESLINICNSYAQQPNIKPFISKLLNFLVENPECFQKVFNYSLTTAQGRNRFHKYIKKIEKKQDHSFPITIDSILQTFPQNVVSVQIQEHEGTPQIMVLDMPEIGLKRTAEEAILDSSLLDTHKRAKFGEESPPLSFETPREDPLTQLKAIVNEHYLFGRQQKDEMIQLMEIIPENVHWLLLSVILDILKVSKSNRIALKLIGQLLEFLYANPVAIRDDFKQDLKHFGNSKQARKNIIKALQQPDSMEVDQNFKNTPAHYHFSTYENDRSVEEVLRTHPDLISVDLGNNTRIKVQSLVKFNKIESFKLGHENLQVTDECIAQFTNLTYLHLGVNARVRGKCLQDLSLLTKLNLGYYPKMAVAGLTSLINLKCLKFQYCPQINDAILSSLTLLTALKVQQPADQISNESIKNLTGLLQLDLRSRHVSGSAIRVLTGLTHLAMPEFSITDFDLSPLKNLVSLDVDTSNLSMNSLSLLKELKYINGYEIETTEKVKKYSNFNSQVLLLFKNLRKLELSDKFHNPEDLKLFTNLTYLDLGNTFHIEIKHLIQLTKLKKLVLDDKKYSATLGQQVHLLYKKAPNLEIESA